MTDDRTGPLNQPAPPPEATSGTDAPDPASGRHDDAARLGRGARSDVFEVFRQEKDGDPMRHAGNVVAPDLELAGHYAREFYGRRQESVRLWVVPRTAVTDLSDPDLLQPPLDRSFKKPGGYVMRDKLEEAKRRAGRDSRGGSAGRDSDGGSRKSAAGKRRTGKESRRGNSESAAGERRTATREDSER